MSVSDEPCPGLLKTATSEDNGRKVHDLTLAHHRLKVREIAETVAISIKKLSAGQAVDWKEDIIK